MKTRTVATIIPTSIFSIIAMGCSETTPSTDEKPAEPSVDVELNADRAPMATPPARAAAVPPRHHDPVKPPPEPVANDRPDEPPYHANTVPTEADAPPEPVPTNSAAGPEKEADQAIASDREEFANDRPDEPPYHANTVPTEADAPPEPVPTNSAAGSEKEANQAIASDREKFVRATKLKLTQLDRELDELPTMENAEDGRKLSSAIRDRRNTVAQQLAEAEGATEEQWRAMAERVETQTTTQLSQLEQELDELRESIKEETTRKRKSKT